MNTIELLEHIRDGKLEAEKERKIIEGLLELTTESTINMSKFVLENPQYFSDDGVKKAKKFLEELGKE